MNAIEYMVYCSKRGNRYSKKFKNKSDAKAFYDRSCGKWPEVYLVKYELVDKGSWIYPQNYQYIYYSNTSMPIMITKDAEYRNIAKR